MLKWFHLGQKAGGWLCSVYLSDTIKAGMSLVLRPPCLRDVSSSSCIRVHVCARDVLSTLQIITRNIRYPSTRGNRVTDEAGLLQTRMRACNVSGYRAAGVSTERRMAFLFANISINDKIAPAIPSERARGYFCESFAVDCVWPLQQYFILSGVPQQPAALCVWASDPS